MGCLRKRYILPEHYIEEFRFKIGIIVDVVVLLEFGVGLGFGLGLGLFFELGLSRASRLKKSGERRIAR